MQTLPKLSVLLSSLVASVVAAGCMACLPTVNQEPGGEDGGAIGVGDLPADQTPPEATAS